MEESGPTPEFDPLVPLDRTFDALIGLEYEVAGPELARGTVEVADHHKQPYGIVHGGVLAAIAESLASAATAAAVIPEGMIAVGLSNQTSFLRPVTGGTIHAEARRRHRGRTTWVWEVDLTDDEGRLCAIVRMTIAVRPLPQA
ncbi:MAG: PaaI family thioesterase [Acidobacteria bacterium]|nr:PaaI family thioesterase [Solirubrobacteraceae bacterium]MBU6336860.1 PaaI family thioesterase [Acidobacteriota bacterium]